MAVSHFVQVANSRSCTLSLWQLVVTIFLELCRFGQCCGRRVETLKVDVYGQGKDGAGAVNAHAISAQTTAMENSPMIRPSMNGRARRYIFIPPYRITTTLISHATKHGNQNTIIVHE